jgi:DNA-binding CsgD family transcriptional regulator
MTHLLFWPDPHTLIWQDDPRPPEALLDQILAGGWQPPAPFPPLPTGAYLATRLGDTLVITLAAGGESRQRLRPLTRRQREVLHALADGATTRQMALRLHLSPRTVLYHVAELKRIFGAQTRAELIALSSELRAAYRDEPPAP